MKKICFIVNIVLLGWTLNAYANPQGEVLVAGAAAFDRSVPNTLTVTTSSDKTIINYSSFSIAANETANFIQPSAASAVLNRVTGVDPTIIYGALHSNGKLFLVNPNGIIFGAGSQVNAPAIVASTLDIRDNDFLNGNYTFFKNGKSSYIINKGRIAAQPGGYVTLLSQAVDNEGVIIADLGSVALASGEAMTLALDSQSQISVAISATVQSKVIGPDGQQIKSAIKNSGTLQANGGKVLLTAQVMNDVFDDAVNNSGVIQATALQNHNGVVELDASGAPAVNSGTIKATRVNINSASNFTNTGSGNLQANQVTIKVPNAIFVNQGQVTSQLVLGLPDSGNISIEALSVEQDGGILADKTIDIAAGGVNTTTPFQGANSPAIIRANQVNIAANNLGAAGLPVAIDAVNINFNKTSGDIDLAASQGIGSNIMATAPPGGFGSLIYNPSANLTLQSSSGSISLNEGASLEANNLTLVAQNGIYSAGSLVASNTLSLLSPGDISSQGVLRSSSLMERGKTFQVGGIFEPGSADVKNADNALTYSSSTNVSGTITDPGSIIVNNGVTLTMTGNTTFQAGTAFTMNTTSTIAGGGYNLSISAASASTVDFINNVNQLTLGLASGSSVTYTQNGNITAANLTIGANTTLSAGSHTITLTGSSGTLLTKTGTFTQGTSTVNVTAGGDATLNSGTMTFGTLTINSPGYTISTSGAVTDTTLNLTAGTLSLGGNLTSTNATISSGATLAAGANTLTSSGTFSNSGTLTTSGTGSNLSISGSNLGSVNFSNTASSLPNKTYGTLTLANGGTSTGAVTASSLALNGGSLNIGTTLTLSGGGTTSGALSDTTLTLNGGTLFLGGNLTSTNVTIASGATLAAGGNTVTSSGTFSNSGTLTTSGTGSNLSISGSNLGPVTFSNTASSLPSKTYTTLTLSCPANLIMR